MTKRLWLYWFTPLLVICLCMTAWISLRPRITLWRIERQVRKLLGGTLAHDGFISDQGRLLVLHPSLSAPHAIQAEVLSVSSDKESVTIIHPTLSITALELPMGSMKSPFDWSIVDGYLYWMNTNSNEGPIQPYQGIFLVNGSWTKQRSELILSSIRDGVIQVIREAGRVVVFFERANLALLNDWFSSKLTVHPLAGSLDGELEIGLSAEGWHILSGSLRLDGAAMQIADSGWLLELSRAMISIGGERLVVRAESSGRLIDPAGDISWACSDCQLYLEEGSEGSLKISGQGEEMAQGRSVRSI